VLHAPEEHATESAGTPTHSLPVQPTQTRMRSCMHASLQPDVSVFCHGVQVFWPSVPHGTVCVLDPGQKSRQPTHARVCTKVPTPHGGLHAVVLTHGVHALKAPRLQSTVCSEGPGHVPTQPSHARNCCSVPVPHSVEHAVRSVHTVHETLGPAVQATNCCAEPTQSPTQPAHVRV
jgi:hypothetical protein